MRRTLGPALLVGAWTACAAYLLGCNKRTPEPGENVPAAASASAASSALAAASALAAKMKQIPHAKPPPDDPDAGPPKPEREPDWDLDTDDPWQDYATRYVRATKRYADAMDCVIVGKGEGAGGKRNVTVRNNPNGSCGAATPKDDAVRDVLVVDVAADRLGVDDPDKRAHLERWPDGSDPGGPPKALVREVDDLRKWNSSMHEDLRDMKLTAVRAQAYGRGTYLVLTFAGWHEPILRTMSPEELKPAADRLCKSNAEMPMGIFAGLDRSHMLRIACRQDGAKTRWDKL